MNHDFVCCAAELELSKIWAVGHCRSVLQLFIYDIRDNSILLCFVNKWCCNRSTQLNTYVTVDRFCELK